MPERRFPPPWSVEEQAACFVVIVAGCGKGATPLFLRFIKAKPAQHFPG